MRIAVSASAPDLESPVDPRFGRCPFYLIVDDVQQRIRVQRPEGAVRDVGIDHLPP